MRKGFLAVLLAMMVVLAGGLQAQGRYDVATFAVTDQDSTDTATDTSPAYCENAPYLALLTKVSDTTSSDTAIVAIQWQFSNDGTTFYTFATDTVTVVDAVGYGAYYYNETNHPMAKYFRPRFVVVDGTGVSVTVSVCNYFDTWNPWTADDGR